MIKNNRIEAIVSETNGIDTLLDIGCDHGYVIKKAFEKGYINKAIAADINKMPLESAKSNLVGYPATFYLSNGFINIDKKEQFDGVVIAGVGSELITEILSNNPNEDNKTFILQPNGKYEILRRYLVNNNYKIIDEILIFDKFYYIIIKAIRGSQQLTEEEIYLGPILMNKKASIEYYKHKLDKYFKLTNLKGTKKEEIQAKIELLQKTITKLSEE